MNGPSRRRQAVHPSLSVDATEKHICDLVALYYKSKEESYMAIVTVRELSGLDDDDAPEMQAAVHDPT